MISKRGGCNCLLLKYPSGCWVENGLWRGKTGSMEISRRLLLGPEGVVGGGGVGWRWWLCWDLGISVTLREEDISACNLQVTSIGLARWHERSMSKSNGSRRRIQNDSWIGRWSKHTDTAIQWATVESAITGGISEKAMFDRDKKTHKVLFWQGKICDTGVGCARKHYGYKFWCR